jgi:succinate dehydrogenase / fumarate reductase cytochrome b subunit
MSTEERPLSPHLTIYRWPITMTLSILHRMTGVALSVGLVAFVLWLEAIAYDAVPYDGVTAFFGSLPGQLMLLGWCFAFFFHLANGIRHLIWDTGRLFEKHQADASAWFVIVAAVLMTAAYWLMV